MIFALLLQVAVPPLDGIEALSVGAWVRPLRRGEQHFLRRGDVEIAPAGDRLFKPREDLVTFLLGTDERGFFMGAVHGNGRMPFPFVTLNELPTQAWSRLVAVKDARGFQHFYVNGALAWSDVDAAAAGVVRPFRDAGGPARSAGDVDGLLILPRAMTSDEVRADYEAGRGTHAPTTPGASVALRAMNAHPEPGLWAAPVTAETWPRERERIRGEMMKLFGTMPAEKPPPEPREEPETDCGSYTRRKVSIQVEPGDRMPLWLLVPKGLAGRAPAVICFYGTTSGAGKDTTVGLSGPKPGTPPEKNRAFAVDMAEAGFVAVAPDWLRDGERVAAGRRPYDTTDFYATRPEGSVHGKDAWDTMRLVDWLQTLPFVDAGRIGMVGHSYGGHSTIFTAALEPRIKAAWANGPVSDFTGHGLHWAAPKGAGASQSLPALRPYLLEHRRPPVSFYEITALIAPRALAVGQAVGERRPHEEENHAAVAEVYRALGAGDRVRYVWYPGDHDFPPHVRREAVEWLRRGLK
jgi:dienelactone hydrolase